jgi:hypothetical protein
MTLSGLIALALLPILAGVTLDALHPLSSWYLDESRGVGLRRVLIAAQLVTATALGFGSFVATDGAVRLLPNDGAEAPIQFMGLLSLVYAIVSALVLTIVVIVTAMDLRQALGRGKRPPA